MNNRVAIINLETVVLVSVDGGYNRFFGTCEYSAISLEVVLANDGFSKFSGMAVAVLTPTWSCDNEM